MKVLNNTCDNDAFFGKAPNTSYIKWDTLIYLEIMHAYSANIKSLKPTFYSKMYKNLILACT